MELFPNFVQRVFCQSHTPRAPALPQIWKMSIWMANFNHATPKRTSLICSSLAIHRLATGKLLQARKPAAFKTAVTYFNAAGEKRYKGSPFLKSTQQLAQNCFLKGKF